MSALIVVFVSPLFIGDQSVPLLDDKYIPLLVPAKILLPLTVKQITPPPKVVFAMTHCAIILPLTKNASKKKQSIFFTNQSPIFGISKIYSYFNALK